MTFTFKSHLGMRISHLERGGGGEKCYRYKEFPLAELVNTQGTQAIRGVENTRRWIDENIQNGKI